MVGSVIVTHGPLAQALLETARLIVGDLPHVIAVGLEPWEGPSVCNDKVHRAVDEVDDGDGVIIFADLPGGTPCNVGLTCVADRRVEVVTGVNLSMLVKLRSAQLAQVPLGETAHQVAAYGTRSVKIASEDLAFPQPSPSPQGSK